MSTPSLEAYLQADMPNKLIGYGVDRDQIAERFLKSRVIRASI